MIKYLFLLVFLWSCSSIEKKADEHFEKGSYEEAVKLYEKALKKDPDSSELVAKLKNAQFKFIDSKLIAVRKLRVGSQNQAASDLLLSILGKQDQWQSFPKGAVAFSETEEVRYAHQYLVSQVDAAIVSEKPLRGSYTLKTYARILSVSESQDVPLLKVKLAKLGQKNCAAMGAQANQTVVFYAGLAASICQYYGANAEKLAKLSTKQREQLYAKLSLAVDQGGSGENNSELFTNLMAEEFKKSPWYEDGAAKTLTASARIAFNHVHETRPIRRSFHYEVSIPYTDYEEKSVAFQEPYTAYRSVCDAGSRCREVAETNYRTKYRTVKEPVTRYRSEPRSYPLLVTQHTLNLAYKAQITSQTEGFSATDTSQVQNFVKSDEEHHEDMPDIGLHPDPLDLPASDAWLTQQYQVTADDYRTKLISLWEERFCTAAKQNGSPQVIDQYEKCLRSTLAAPPAHVNAWYEQAFGIDAVKVHGLIKS